MRKRESKEGKEARHQFYERVLDKGGCWLHRIVPHECDGPIDPCHLFPKQRLKNMANLRGYEEKEMLAMVWDDRNGIPGCRSFHHRLDNGFIRIYWPQLPRAVKEFAADWDLEWEMKQIYREETPHE